MKSKISSVRPQIENIQTRSANDNPAARLGDVFRVNLVLTGETARLARELKLRQGYRSNTHLVSEALRALQERLLDLELKHAQVERLRTPE